jgi:hypothetical protein
VSTAVSDAEDRRSNGSSRSVMPAMWTDCKVRLGVRRRIRHALTTRPTGCPVGRRDEP